MCVNTTLSLNKTRRALVEVTQLHGYYELRVQNGLRTMSLSGRNRNLERDRARRSMCKDIQDTLREPQPAAQEIEWYLKCLNIAFRQEADIYAMSASDIESHPIIRAAEALGCLLDERRLTKLYARMNATAYH